MHPVSVFWKQKVFNLQIFTNMDVSPIWLFGEKSMTKMIECIRKLKNEQMSVDDYWMF